jgi:glycosyltransferase involved in cell wall biosynthesis
MPVVSVIVPNYNHARFLRQRIDSILAQTFRDFELILLDDCSTDDSRPILAEYATDPRVRVEFNETNSGTPFKQWNKGVGMARGKYVWIAESDDHADARFLERLVSVLESDPALTFAYCRSVRVSADDRADGFAVPSFDPERWARDFREGGAEMCREYFCRSNIVPNASAVVFRKDVYGKLGGADESFRTCGDWKLWAAMALEGSVAYVSEPLNYFRFHEASVRNQTILARVDVEEHLRVCGWVLGRVECSDKLRDEVCEAVADYWVSAIMSFGTPLSLKRQILRNVKRLDPHPVRRALRPAVDVAWRKVRRHWRDVRSAHTPPASA